MKLKLILVVLAMLISTSAFSQKKDWAKLDRYAQANKELGLPKKGEHRVIFLGNSITQNWAGMRPEFFKDNGYIGRGIGGQTSYQFLVRFRQDVIDLKPEVVVINVGTNDLAENTHPFDLDRTMGNIKTMVDLARYHGIDVVLTSVLPATEFKWNQNITDAPQRVKRLNAAIQAYAKEENLPYVDYYPAMAYGPDGIMNPAYSEDGVHPNHEGYAAMEPIIRDFLQNRKKIK